ncbi:MAG: PadR family transcriptional regulator [Gaiellaceae bacterium]
MQTKTSALTATEAAVLGLLTRGPMSGYDLKKRAESSVGYFWDPAKSQIYAVLPRLVEAGFATRRKVAQEQRPDKQVYRITSRGREALKDWIELTPPPPDPARNPLLLKVFFGDLADPETVLEQVRERRREAEQLKAELAELEAGRTGTKSDLFPSLTRSYGRHYADAVIRWARDVERELGTRDP